MYCSARINPSVLQVSTRIGFIAKQRMSVVTKPRTHCYHKWFNLPLKLFSAFFLSFCWLTEIRVWHCLSRTTLKRSFIKSTSSQNQQVTIQQLKIRTHPRSYRVFCFRSSHSLSVDSFRAQTAPRPLSDTKLDKLTSFSQTFLPDKRSNATTRDRKM